jgi:hypothetical protein
VDVGWLCSDFHPFSSSAGFLFACGLMLVLGFAEGLTQYPFPLHSFSTSMTSARSDLSQPAAILASTTSSTTIIPSSTPLPEFRSVQEFTRKPKPDQLPALYTECLQALRQANIARSILKGRMGSKKQMIAAIRLEIDQLLQDFALEENTRVSLHAMNLRLVVALQEMDDLVGNLDKVVDQASRVPRGRLGRLIESLKALIHQWRVFKRLQQQKLTSLKGSQQDGGRF